MVTERMRLRLPLGGQVGGRDDERRVHSLLRNAWETGEWFACSREAVRLAMEAKNVYV